MYLLIGMFELYLFFAVIAGLFHGITGIFHFIVTSPFVLVEKLINLFSKK